MLALIAAVALQKVDSNFYELTPLRRLRCTVVQDVVFGSNSTDRAATIYAVLGLPSSDSFQKTLKIDIPSWAKIAQTSPTKYPVVLFTGQTQNARQTQRLKFSFDVEVQGKTVRPEACRKISWDAMASVSSDLRQWLEPEPFVQCRDSAIRGYVTKVLGTDFKTKFSPFEALQKLYEYMARDFEDGSGPIYPQTAVNVIECRKGACTGASYVFIACARYMGIPARAVSAYGYADSGCHTWSEVYLPGAEWFSIDVDSAMVIQHANGRIPTFGDASWLRNWVSIGRGNRYEIYGHFFDRVDYVNGFAEGGYCGALPPTDKTPRKRMESQWTTVEEIKPSGN